MPQCPPACPDPMRSVILVDERGTAAQREALASLARELGAEWAGRVVSVEAVPIDLEVAGHSDATLCAGGLVEVRTRPLHEGDAHCGNETVYYEPLTDVRDAMPAFTVAHAFRGEGLGGTWSSPGRRSAFLATFTR